MNLSIKGLRRYLRKTPKALLTTLALFLTILAWGVNKIRPSYGILSTPLLLVPLSTGGQSMLRITLEIFPVCIILTEVSKKTWVDQSLTASLALLQGGLVLAWIQRWTLPI